MRKVIRKQYIAFIVATYGYLRYGKRQGREAGEGGENREDYAKIT